jgi:hypothetical protein
MSFCFAAAAAVFTHFCFSLIRHYQRLRDYFEVPGKRQRCAMKRRRDMPIPAAHTPRRRFSLITSFLRHAIALPIATSSRRFHATLAAFAIADTISPPLRHAMPPFFRAFRRFCFCHDATRRRHWLIAIDTRHYRLPFRHCHMRLHAIFAIRQRCD